ncbi:MAG: hypothetical protein COS99_06275 [Candidatus Omnitrophica bacterium CG07_land_8_20_14_0_80_42_15]|uniref:Uncharacterized protein n=1 Tax=Candidatus Aquitaenariimonas noxiae TaxID=1974741 RepID=A0A2J0KRW3_9BACT|nr:MAG: hypothetical protein COS99_06275 [Candidatus Omnitrophica bacterium CG07_land_8_20_14_0_80_42_15]
MKQFFAIITSLFIALLIILLLAMLFPQTILNLYLKHIEKSLNIDISFSSKQVSLVKAWHFKDVKISSKAGYVVNAKDLFLYPPFFSVRKGEIYINCDAKELGFHKDMPVIDSVFNLISLESFGNITFDDVKAKIALKQSKMDINNLEAVGKDIKIFGRNTTDIKGGAIDCNLKFLFSKNITDDIGDTVKVVLLKKEDDSWMGIDVEVKGDYKRPILNLKSDFLNLRIKGIGVAK